MGENEQKGILKFVETKASHFFGFVCFFVLKFVLKTIHRMLILFNIAQFVSVVVVVAVVERSIWDLQFYITKKHNRYTSLRCTL